MVLQDCNRYIVVHKDKILGIKGWVRSKNINTNQLRLFNTPSAVRQYFEMSSYKNPVYDLVKVKVQIEVIEEC
jgi:hypothetical protein